MELKTALAQAKKALEQKKAERLAATQKGGAQPAPKKGAMPEAMTKSLRNFGVTSMDELLKVNTAEKKYGYLPKEEIEKVKALKEAADVAVLCAKIFKKDVKQTKYFKDELQFTLKAFGITAGNEGFEWIPTMVADSYIDEFNLSLS